ncbi:hypothetical protein LA635_2776 [Erwinia amylovora LA635]|nr:hypothetical protein LA635_2776 [Erwinia amylovora LA635]CDK19766.1 hypothetical protein LA636_2774 [Erwinia amylovora LA636]CDK23138.1 hypothetical protein LA637_2778 [Erwinia amylovora LA637]
MITITQLRNGKSNNSPYGRRSALAMTRDN